MKKKRYSPEQIIAELRAAEVDLATGIPIEQLCKQLEVSAATWLRALGPLEVFKLKLGSG